MQFSKNDAVESLSNDLKIFKWFKGIEKDEFGRLIVYSDTLYTTIFNVVPDTVNNTKVLIHYDISRNIDKNKYVNDVKQTLTSQVVQSTTEEVDKTFLEEEIDELLQLVDEDIIYHVFFEIVDGDNAVTDLSPTYKTVRLVLEDLYNTYGFDVMYDYIATL